jgi:NitT/TauT family transport system ATP-binding protein
VVMSPRPGCIDRVVTVDLPRPRADKTRALPRFFELVTEVRQSLREAPGLAGEPPRPSGPGAR